MPTPVKDFWTKPVSPGLNITEIEFGYTEQGGKKKRYKAEQKTDKLSFQTFVFILLDTKKKSINPWYRLSEMKKKVRVINLDDEAIQTELPLKVAKKFMNRKNS
jgi:hypothetical protein